MHTRFFKFPNVETAFELAKQNGLTTKDENNQDILIRFSHEYAIDVIGILNSPSGNILTTENGIEYPEMIPVDGWHINVRVSDGNIIPDEFLQYEIFPNSPSRDFA